MTRQTDAEAVRGVLAGDSSRFGELVTKYSAVVWAVCRSRVAANVCEDVVQETFLRALERLESLREPSAFGPWVVQIARNQCADWGRDDARRKAQLKKYQDETTWPARATDSPERAAAASEAASMMLGLIDRLPPDTREALFLYYAQGLSVHQAAEMLGTTRAALRKRLQYGRDLLKSNVDREVWSAFALAAAPQSLAARVLDKLPVAEGCAAGTMGSGGFLGTKTLVGILGVSVMPKKLIFLFGLCVLLLAGLFTIHPAFIGRKDQPQPPSASETSPATMEAVSPDEPVTSSNSLETGIAVPTPPPAAVPVPVTSAAQANGEVQPKEEKAFSISGMVLDNAAYPIPGATVTVEATDEEVVVATAMCEVDGTYRVEGQARTGTGSVFAGAPGYVMERTRLPLTEGHDDVNFILTPAEYMVAGWVVNERSAPVSGARVACCFYGYEAAHIDTMAATGGTVGYISDTTQLFCVSGADGYFELAVPQEGLCDLVVICGGYGRAFYPRMATGTDDNVLQLSSPGGIAGTVRDTQGAPVAGASVQAKGIVFPAGIVPARPIQSLASPTHSVMTDQEGRYAIDGLASSHAYMVRAVRSVSGAPDSGLSPWSPVTQSDEAILRDIRVEPGRTTTSVDLTLGNGDHSIVKGTVTDRTTGEPVHPVRVLVVFREPGEDGKLRSGQAATFPDGSYRLELADLTEPCEAVFSCNYSTQGGTVWDSNDEPAEEHTIRPGETQIINLECDAPMSIPVRVVDVAGNGMPGLTSMIRLAEGSGMCGGVVRSDKEGRFRLDGLPARYSYVVLAADTSAGGLRVLGESKPVAGAPGETVTEVTIVCRERGGIEGTLSDLSGQPIAKARLIMIPFMGTTTTDTQGYFCCVDAFPEGRHDDVQIIFTLQDGSTHEAVVPPVDIAAGMISNVGTLTASPAPSD